MSKTQHACYECGSTFLAEPLEHYSSRQLCEQCRAERTQRWLRATAIRDAHVHDWQPRGSNRSCACGGTLFGTGDGE
jgi:hypothetical protein